MLNHLEMWIRNIVVIIVLTSFVELLLPRNQLEKYTRVVLGLFIVIAILNPMLNLFNGNYDFRRVSELLAVEENKAPEMSQIKQAGKELRNSTRQEAQNDYKNQIARQVSAILSFDNDLPSAEVNVNLRANNQIENIKIELKEKPKDKPSKKVKQVEVNEVDLKDKENLRASDQNNELKISKKIKKRLANFYGLNTDQVLVQVD